MMNIKRQSGRIKVFVIEGDKMDGVSWWRSARPFSALDKTHGDKIEIIRRGESVDVRELMTADVVVRYRPTTQKAFDFLKLCREFGAKIILDIDDDLWHVPPSHPDFGEFSGEKTKNLLWEVYRFADAVWASTKHILYSADCLAMGEVMQNAILPSELPDKPMEWRSVAAWRGHSKHVGDFTDAAREWYKDCAHLYEHFVFAGYFPVLAHGANARFAKGVDPLAYFLSLKNGFANVFWKPLEDCPFNDGKSNIAWIEATMSGGVCVTNYAEKTGWECALPDFTTDPDLIARTWQASCSIILENYNLLEVNERRFKSIVKLVNG